jgi:hypothetical protein
LKNGKLRVLFALAAVMVAVGVFAPNASAWHFKPIGTSECLQKVDDLCKTRITVTAEYFSSPATIPIGVTTSGSRYSINSFTQDETGSTQVGPAGYGQPTTFVNGTNTFEVWLPCDLVKMYVIKHKDQSKWTKVPIDYDVPTCKSPPIVPPTPPVVPQNSPPVEGKSTPEISVNVANLRVSVKCVKTGGRIGYHVTGRPITKVEWTWYINGKKYKKTTKTKSGKKRVHYIRVKSKKVEAKIFFRDGSSATIPGRYDVACKKPAFTG